MFKHLIFIFDQQKKLKYHGNNKMGLRPNALRSTI
jgi:hypothetical protein